MGGDRGRLAVVGVDEHAVRQALDALADAVELPVERRRGRPTGKRSSVTSRVEYSLDQLARRALGDDLRLVHDDEPVAQLLGLVHVVRRQDQRHAALLEPVQPLPEQVAGLRVEARSSARRGAGSTGSLISARAIVRRRFMPPDSGSTLSFARSVSWANSSSSSAAARGLGPRQAEVPAVDHEVVADRELGVERVLLGHDAEAAADPRAVGVGVEVEDAAACPRSPARRTRSSASCWSCRRRWARGSRSSRPPRRRSRSRRRP